MVSNATEQAGEPAAVAAAAPEGAAKNETLDIRTLVFHPKKGDSSTFLDGLSMCGVKNRDVVQTMKDGLDRLIVKHYDLIIVTFLEDSQVSDHFVDELKNLEATASIPLIAITTDGRPKNVLRIMAKGVDQALVSPFSLKAVREAINAALWPEKAKGVAGALHVAWRKHREGKQDESLRGFEKILKRAPGCVEAKLGLATIRLERDEASAGCELLKDAMTEAKKLSNVVEQYTLLSRIYQCMGDHFTQRKATEQAIKHYKAALKLNPFNLATLPQLLGIMSGASSVDDILDFLDSVKGDFAPFTASQDHMAECLEGLIKRYQALNIQENVDKVYLYLSTVDHTDSDLHLKMADYLKAQGENGLCQAREYLERVTVGVRDTDVMCRLADLYTEVSKAVAARSNSPQPGIPEELECFADLGYEDLVRSAYDWYNESLMIEPFEPAIWLNLVRCHLWLDDAARAEHTLSRMLDSIDVDADLLAQIGGLLVDEKAYEMAESYVQQGVRDYPKDSRFHLMQGRLYAAQGENFKAVAALKAGLNENAENVECMIELAKNYGALGKWSDAIEYYEQAKRISPDDPEIAEGLQSALKQKYAKKS